jgi:hypothetical protein
VSLTIDLYPVPSVTNIGAAHLECTGPTLLSGSIPVKSPPDKVGIATRYGLDGPGIVSRWRRDFPLPYRRALGPTQPFLQWLLGLLPHGVDHPPHLAMKFKKIQG